MRSVPIFPVRRVRMVAMFSTSTPPNQGGNPEDDDSPIVQLTNSMKKLLASGFEKEDGNMMNMLEMLARMGDGGFPDINQPNEEQTETILDFMIKTAEVNPEYSVPKTIFPLIHFSNNPRFLEIVQKIGGKYLSSVESTPTLWRPELRTLMQFVALFYKENKIQAKLPEKALKLVMGSFNANYPRLNYIERVYLYLVLKELGKPEWKDHCQSVENDIIRHMVELDTESIQIFDRAVKQGLPLTDENKIFLEEITLKLIHTTFNIPQVWHLMALGGRSDEFWEGLTPVIINTLPYASPQSKLQVFARLAELGKEQGQNGPAIFKLLETEVNKLSQPDKLKLFHVLTTSKAKTTHISTDDLFEEINSSFFGQEVPLEDWKEAQQLYQKSTDFPSNQIEKLKAKAQSFLAK